MTFGSGTAIMWFGARCAVRSNQNRASWFRTWPFDGIRPTTASNADSRSVTTMIRSPRSRSM
jgi:hypothetical protein